MSWIRSDRVYEVRMFCNITFVIIQYIINLLSHLCFAIFGSIISICNNIFSLILVHMWGIFFVWLFPFFFCVCSAKLD